MHPDLRAPRALRASLAAFALGITLLSAGCGGSDRSAAPTAPIALDRTTAMLGGLAPQAPANATALDPGGQGLFVRLVVGDQAVAAHQFRFRITPTGSDTPGPWTTVNARIERVITGTESQAGVSYFDQHETFSEDTGNQGESTNLLREDRSGLFQFQADVPAPALARAAASARLAGWSPGLVTTIDAALAARGQSDASRAAYVDAVTRILGRLAAARSAGPGAQEITLLRYPIRPGATWEGRVGFNRWTVEAHEGLTLPAGRFAAVRLRLEVPGAFGPNDHYTIWYADPGEVAHDGRFEATATDQDGNVIGTVESQDTLELTGWEPASGS